MKGNKEHKDGPSKQKEGQKFSTRVTFLMHNLMKYMLSKKLIRTDQDGYVNIEDLVNEIEKT